MIYNGKKVGRKEPEGHTKIKYGVGLHIEMVTVNGWYANGGGKESGKGVFSLWGRWGKTSVQNFSNLFLEILTEVPVTTEARSLFQEC